MTSMNDERIAEGLGEFWKTLKHQLKLKPHPDGMEDVFSEFRHLLPYIEDDAAENAAHSDLLARANAIRNSDAW